jgi:hypothetical protein
MKPKNPDAEYQRGLAWGLICAAKYVEDGERALQIMEDAKRAMEKADRIDRTPVEVK